MSPENVQVEEPEKTVLQLSAAPSTTNVSCVSWGPRYAAQTKHLSHSKSPRHIHPEKEKKEGKKEVFFFFHLVKRYQIMRHAWGF